jgi:hypothetical protein
MTTLILFGIVLSVLLYWLLWKIGKNKLEKDYDADYEKLVRVVKNYAVTHRNYLIIRKKFALIDKYSCKNEEKLDVLFRGDFKTRFASVIPKRKVNQTKNVKR